ncbi:MAG: biopolymer transport protein ExbB [Akkermansiaceae bacterium]|jgi:biopolymer transport protein ExbB
MQYFLTLLLLVAPVHAQVSIEKATITAKSDLAAALSTLDEVRQTITAEKPKLAAEYQQVAQDLEKKRRLVRIARMTKEDREQAMRQLQSNLSTRERDASFLAGFLKDQALKITVTSTPGQPALVLDPAMIARDATDSAKALTERLPIVSASLNRLEALLGGSQAPGKAVAPDGSVMEGNFAAAGPAIFFQGPTSGLVIQGKGDDLPNVLEDGGDLEALFAGQQAMVNMDVSGGAATALQEVSGGPIDLIRKGGLWVWPILVLALLALVFGIIKALSFAKYREPGEAWVRSILAALNNQDTDKATTLAAEARHPVGPVMENLIGSSSHSHDVVEETLYEELMDVQSKAGSLLPIIAITAATAPLLGLLGTVSGMIRTFNLITVFGSGDPKPLAGGISEALITTLFGLVVAIPALILHAFLSRRSQGIIQTTERLGLSFINGLRKS